MGEPEAWKVRRMSWPAVHGPERLRLLYRGGKGQAEGRWLEATWARSSPARDHGDC